jgi:hypothetical protein
MPDMICSFCGSSFVAGGYCSNSPSGKHVGITNGDCVYCGKPFIIKGVCLYSPTKEHAVEWIG